jgi:hypothetical protein
MIIQISKRMMTPTNSCRNVKNWSLIFCIWTTEHSATNASAGGYFSLLEKHEGQPEQLNINCVDPLNRSALITAIENENIDLMRILLEWNIDVKVCASALSASRIPQLLSTVKFLHCRVHEGNSENWLVL